MNKTQFLAGTIVGFAGTFIGCYFYLSLLLDTILRRDSYSKITRINWQTNHIRVNYKFSYIGVLLKLDK
jgi:hypothetical protein